MRIVFWGIFLPIKNKIQASKTPTPLGAAGTINPIDQDKQNITNKLINNIKKNNSFVLTINKYFKIDEINQLYYDKIKNSVYDIDGMIFLDPAKNNTVFNIYNNNIHSKSISGIFNMKKYKTTIFQIAGKPLK